MSMIPEEQQLEELVRQVGEWLVSRELTIATAESCTGGWIAKCLTDVPGSSAWFEYALVTYSNTMKRQLLGVAAGTLERHGAVSEAVVMEMASGVLGVGNADLGLAVSGVAGPDGGSEDKPVGLVWIAWTDREGRMICERCLFDGDRESIRRSTVETALRGVLRFCDGPP